VAVKAAVVVDEVADTLPQRHRGDRQRHLRHMARQLAHAAGVDAGGMAAGVVLLQQSHGGTAQRQMQRRRAAVNAATDHDHIGGGC